jgi:hypothetical protein
MTHRRRRGIALPFLDQRHYKGVRGQRHAPATLYPRERHGTHCTGGWAGPRASLDRCRKFCPPPGFDPRTVQPIASHYTDWVTRPTMYVPRKKKKKGNRLSHQYLTTLTEVHSPTQLTYRLLIMILTEEDDSGHATWMNGIRCVQVWTHQQESEPVSLTCGKVSKQYILSPKTIQFKNLAPKVKSIHKNVL